MVAKVALTPALSLMPTQFSKPSSSSAVIAIKPMVRLLARAGKTKDR